MNKMASVIENYSKFEVRAVVGFLHVERVSQSDIHRRLVFTARMFSTKRKWLCGATNLKMAE
jgi:hypothetical protein